MMSGSIRLRKAGRHPRGCRVPNVRDTGLSRAWRADGVLVAMAGSGSGVSAASERISSPWTHRISDVQTHDLDNSIARKRVRVQISRASWIPHCVDMVDTTDDVDIVVVQGFRTCALLFTDHFIQKNRENQK